MLPSDALFRNSFDPTPQGPDLMLSAKTPALIFDFGNVMAYFDYDRIGAVLGQGMGLTGQQFMHRAREAGFTPLLQAYESGHLSSEDFGQKVCGLMGLDLPHSEFALAWEGIFWLNEPVARLVADLKSRGYTLVLGSNTNEMHARFYTRQFADELAPFDQLVLSHEVGHIKPKAEFYLECAKAAGAAPSDCVFIDDMPENVNGARAAGLRGLLFRDVESLRHELLREGVDLR